MCVRLQQCVCGRVNACVRVFVPYGDTLSCSFCSRLLAEMLVCADCPGTNDQSKHALLILDLLQTF